MDSLAGRFDGRRNAFDLVRLLLAVVVALTHLTRLGYDWEPHWPGGLELGAVALDGFFVLSGFLVTRSWLGLGSLPRFVWHRFLRIMPGYWVCLVVVAAVVAPVAALLAGNEVGDVVAGPESAVSYVGLNAALLYIQPGIAGTFDGLPVSGAADGALWTLAYEACCYAMVAVLGVLAVLRRRRRYVLGLAAALLALAIGRELGVDLPTWADLASQLTLMFVLGTIGCLYAERIPARASLAAVGVLVFAGSTLVLDDYRILGGVGFAYALLWLCAASPLRVRLRVDVSYGVYIYHWPILQLLVLAGLADVGPAAYVPAAVVLTTLCALASWYAVERRALAQRHRPAPAWWTRWRARRQPFGSYPPEAGVGAAGGRTGDPAGSA